MGRRDYSRDWYCIFPLCPCSTYWNRYCGRSCFVGILQLYKCQSQELSTYYKQEVIAQILQSFCENAVFTPEEGIKESTFRNCALFTSPDRYHTEDLIQGRVGKTDFCCAEIMPKNEKQRSQFKRNRQVIIG